MCFDFFTRSENYYQFDADGDIVGDVCDNCVATANADQADRDADSVGDVCDNCPDDPNTDQADTDGDGVADACDNCHLISNAGQPDTDGDEQGDACDDCTDTDGDGFGNPGFAVNTCPVDNCPYADNPTQDDGDQDGIGDACERIVHVSETAQGANDGSSWTDAFVSLQDALALAAAAASTAQPVSEIWVAAGTYKPAGLGGDRAVSFRLLSRVPLYGGFSGDETAHDPRDPAANPTILSGDLNGDDAMGFKNDNSQYVVRTDGVDATGLIDGFIVAAGGMGIYASSGGARITNCRVTGNTGLGIQAGGAVTVNACTVDGNTGTGIYAVGSVAISDCTIIDNYSSSSAGGAYLGDDATIRRCTIHRNRGYRGGGLACEERVLVENCSINANTATISGGGVHIPYGYPELTIRNCLISGNQVTASAPNYNTGGGGGLYVAGGTMVITGCVFSRNSALLGGAIDVYRSTPSIIQCSIVANSATCSDSGGGGIHSGPSSNVTLANSVVWNNTARTGAQLSLDYFPDCCTPGRMTVSYCAVQGGEAAVFVRGTVAGGSPLTWGEGNIETDLLLAFSDDPHLLPGSPCIDTATLNPPGGLPTIDLDGNTRPLDGNGDGSALPDIGAYEFNADVVSLAVSPRAIEVRMPEGGTPDVGLAVSIRSVGGEGMQWQLTSDVPWLDVSQSSGDNTGEIDEVELSVDPSGVSYGVNTAEVVVSGDPAVNTPQALNVTVHVYRIHRVPSEYPTIQVAIDATALEGDVVLVADGVYSGDGNWNIEFRGKPITVRSENGPANCIIDCSTSDPASTCRGFYFFDSAEKLTSVVDGFTITGGHASSGGGILCDAIISSISGPSPTIRNCVFRRNHASHSGGAMFAGVGAPILVGCLIEENSAEWYGGGVVFELAKGGRLVNCHLRGNVAGRGGGGASLGGGPEVEVTNCIFSGNRAADAGGLYIVSRPQSARIFINNCTIVGNFAQNDGGGIRFTYPNYFLGISNSIVRANRAATGPQIAFQCSQPITPGYVSIRNNNVEDGLLGIGASQICGLAGLTWDESNIDEEPLFSAPGYWSDAGTPDDPADDVWVEGVYDLQEDSPGVSEGDGSLLPLDAADLDGDGDTQEPLPLDLARRPRVHDVLDMGALEYTPGVSGDIDGDGAPDASDNCPWQPNPGQEDDDGDGVGDTCDLCPDSLPGAVVDALGCSSRVPADFDGDGDVDQSDFAHLQMCLSGFNQVQTDPACQDAKLDSDADVDQSDVAIFLGCLSGAKVPADPDCTQ